MRCGLGFYALLLLGLLNPAKAWALDGLKVSASLGQGVLLSPQSPGKADETSLLIAPGWAPTPVLHLELGIMLGLDKRAGGKLDLHLRPMLVVAPRSFPLYARLSTGVANLLEGTSGLLLGAALGLRSAGRIWGAPDWTFFVEAGLLGQRDKAQRGNEAMHYIAEFRFGGTFDLPF